MKSESCFPIKTSTEVVAYSAFESELRLAGPLQCLRTYGGTYAENGHNRGGSQCLFAGAS